MRTALALCAVAVATCASAATPPGVVNYQGVLRSAAGAPLSGTYDMVFRFYDDPVTSGNEILVDSHVAPPASSAVVVTNGLFNTLLGGGAVSDGAGAGTYTSLGEVFRDFGTVYLGVQVNVGVPSEILTPRIRVSSAAYALNADNLDGLTASQLLRSDQSGTVAGVVQATGFAGSGANLSSLNAGNVSTGTLAVARGGTGTGTYAAGDVLYANAANSLARLAAGGSGTFLRSNGTAPSWATIGPGDVTGLLRKDAADTSAASLATAGGYLYDLTQSNTTAATGQRSVLRLTDNTTTPGLFDYFLVGRSGSGGTPFAVTTAGVVAGSLFKSATGSAAAPTFTFGGDQDTGMFSPSVNTVALVAGGTGQLTMAANGDTTIGNRVFVEGAYAYIDSDGPDEDQALFFYDGGSLVAESLGWDDSESRFELSDEVAMAGPLRVGTTVSASVAYNSFGTATPVSTAITDANDVFVAGELEVGGTRAVIQGTSLWLNAAGPDATSTIYFYDAALPGDEYLSWNDALNVFLLSSDLTLFGSYTNPASMNFVIDNDNNAGGLTFNWYEHTLAASDKLADLSDSGNLRIRGTLSQNVTFDLAESFLKSQPVEPGDVVAVDPKRRNAVVPSAGETDGRVLGVVSERPGVLLGSAPFDVEALGETWGQDVKARFLADEPALAAQARATLIEGGEVTDDKVQSMAIQLFFDRIAAPVALAGRVPVKVDSQYGAIAPGDQLQPSPIPGVAMRHRGTGPVIGTALEAFDGGRGKVLALVHRGDGGTVGAAPAPSVEDLRREVAAEVERQAPKALANSGSIVLDGKDGRPGFSVFGEGREDAAHELLRVDEAGNLRLKGAVMPQAMDLAEYHPVSERVEAGDVLVLDPAVPRAMRRCAAAADPTVVGIVSSSPGVLLGSGLDPEQRKAHAHAAIALSGTVPCKVDASHGAIAAGDLLVASPTPGHAMRGASPPPGTVIGKALEPLAGGTGTIQVLVMLR